MKTLHIVRGVPGSGKTTFCKKELHITPYEADDFIMRNDDYGYLTKSTGISVNPGMIIAKDDVLLQAPTHEDEDTFKIFGTNLNVAYMAVPQVTEDGIVISESAAERL